MPGRIMTAAKAAGRLLRKVYEGGGTLAEPPAQVMNALEDTHKDAVRSTWASMNISLGVGVVAAAALGGAYGVVAAEGMSGAAAVVSGVASVALAGGAALFGAGMVAKAAKAWWPATKSVVVMLKDNIRGAKARKAARKKLAQRVVMAIKEDMEASGLLKNQPPAAPGFKQAANGEKPQTPVSGTPAPCKTPDCAP